MANPFQANGQEPTLRATLSQKYAVARYDLLLVIAFTVINLLMLVSRTFTYFLFSANVPYLLVYLGMYFGGMFGEEVDPTFYETGYAMLGPGFFYGMLVAAILIVSAYFVCWLLSANGRVGALITALVLFALDTLLVLGLLLIEFSPDVLIDLAFHAYVLYALAVGVHAHYRHKKLLAEAPAAEASATEAFAWEEPAAEATDPAQD